MSPIAGRSVSLASRIATVFSRLAAWLMPGNTAAVAANEKGGPKAARSLSFMPVSATVAEELQQEGEQVDEVEVELERAHDGLAAGDHVVVAREIHLLDALRVPGGEAGKDKHADRRDREAESRRLQEHVDQHRDDEAE